MKRFDLDLDTFPISMELLEKIDTEATELEQRRSFLLNQGNMDEVVKQEVVTLNLKIAILNDEYQQLKEAMEEFLLEFICYWLLPVIIIIISFIYLILFCYKKWRNNPGTARLLSMTNSPRPWKCKTKNKKIKNQKNAPNSTAISLTNSPKTDTSEKTNQVIVEDPKSRLNFMT